MPESAYLFTYRVGRFVLQISAAASSRLIIGQLGANYVTVRSSLQQGVL